MKIMAKKVLVLSSSPRRGGNSDRLCDRFMAGAQQAGHEVEKIFLKDRRIGYCTGCGACYGGAGPCPQKDDAAGVIGKMVEADVIVMATPVYFYTLSAQMKTLIDRCCARYLEMKGKEFRRRVKELAAELNMDTAYLNRELGVGFSGGEKKKVEMLQLLLLQPKLAILDETDSGLDVDALSTVSHGMDAYRKSCDGSMLIITHNTRILEHLDVDRVHVMVKGHIVREDDASLIPWIDKNGFETFEREAAEQRAQAEAAAAEQQA